MSTQWDDAAPWSAAAWQTTEGWRQHQQHNEEVAASWTSQNGITEVFGTVGKRSMGIPGWGGSDSDDAMDGSSGLALRQSLRVDLPLDNRDVLVDQACPYAYPTEEFPTPDTWAAHERKQQSLGGKKRILVQTVWQVG